MTQRVRLVPVVLVPASVVGIVWAAILGGGNPLTALVEKPELFGLAALFAGGASLVGFLLNKGYRSARPVFVGAVACSMAILGSSLSILYVPPLPVQWGMVGLLLPWLPIAAVCAWFSWALTGS